MLAAGAAAKVFCVNAGADPACTDTSLNLTAALASADGNAGADEVHLGPGTYNDAAGWSYGSGAPNTVEIVGSGIGSTTLAPVANAATNHYLQLQQAGNSARDLTVDFSATNFDQDNALVLIQGASAESLRVDGAGVTNAIGAYLGQATADALDVDMPASQADGNRAIYSQGENTVTDSSLTGSQGWNLSSPGTIDQLSRVSIRSDSQGVVTDGGTVLLDDALIDLGSAPGATGLQAANFNAGTADKKIDARHVTIVGGGANSRGIQAWAATSGAKQKSTVDFDDSIISGPAISIQRDAGNDGAQGGASQAEVTTSYSAYDEGTQSSVNSANGIGSIAADHQVSAAPGFVDQPGGNYRLAASSALVDGGEPAPGGPSTDLDGADRVEDGNEDGNVRRDIGAYERQDTTAPETTIDSGASGPTNDSTPSFEFSAQPGGNTFRCAIDGASLPCSGPGNSHTAATLADGAHSFSVFATDAAQNADPSPASRSFTVDTAAPDTSITGGPSGMTGDKTPSFSFASSEPGGSFLCAIDAAALGPCSGPATTHTSAQLSDGPHSFSVQATDPAGNADPSVATREFTVDSGPPETTITSGPTGATSDATPIFGFDSSEAGSSFRCAVDGAALGACSGPGSTHTSASLADGPHSFSVEATDPAGNVDPSVASRSFTVDTRTPAAKIRSGPRRRSRRAKAKFKFTADESGVSFECRLDKKAFSSCSSPQRYRHISRGRHKFYLRATDAAGNVQAKPAKYKFERLGKR